MIATIAHKGAAWKYPQLSKKESFEAKVNGLQSLTVVAKLCILDICGDLG